MKKSIFFSLMFSGLLIAGVLFFAPVRSVFADRIVIDIEKSSPGLVQCGLVGSKEFCDMCDLIVLVKAVLDFIWKGAWVLAAGMMIYGGFYMILPSFGAGGAGMYEKGKKILYNVGWGLLIVFFAWVMIDTIIKVMAGQSLTSGKPATLPKEPASRFQEGPLVGTNPIEFGPWNKISCTRAPERAPLALLEIPEALRCPEGVTSKMVGTVDVCASVAVDAFKTDSSLKGAARGQCNADNIAKLKKSTSCGTKSCGDLIDEIAGAGSEDAKLMRAIVLVESSGSPGAIGPARKGEAACGIAQVLPSTAKKTCTELLDARTGIKEGLKVVRDLRKDSLTGGNLRRILVGYNGGPRALEKSNDCKELTKGECTTKPGGYAETINYFQKVEKCLKDL